MTIKLKIPKRKNGARAGKGAVSRDPVIRVALSVFVVLSVCLCGFFSYFYIKYGRIIDQRFKGPVFSSSASIYAIPRAVRVGEKVDLREIEAQLRRAGYAENDGPSPMGSYRALNNGIEISPVPSRTIARNRRRFACKMGLSQPSAGNRANWKPTNSNPA